MKTSRLDKKQIANMVKAKQLVEKALLLLSQVENNSDLKYTPNRLLSAKTKELATDIREEAEMLGVVL